MIINDYITKKNLHLTLFIVHSLTRTTTRGNQSGHQPPSASAGGGISLFSGISEIISGLSQNSNNNNNVESISNNSSEATLPPSYRTRNNNRHTGNHLRPISAYNNDSNHDFTLAVRSSSMENLSARPLSQHQPPSNSSFSEPQPKNVNNSSSKCTSINSSSSANQNQIDRESISDSKNKSNKKLLNNGNNNDLVTIVTISGFIDENENKKNINEESSATTTEELTSDVCVLAHL